MNEIENKRSKAVMEINYIWENIGQITQKSTLNELEKYINQLQNFLNIYDEYWDKIKTLQTLHSQLKKLYDTL